MMYFPDRAHSTPAQAGLSQAQEVELKAADGEYSLAWHIAPRGDRTVILYFHGNGGALRDRVERFGKLARDGFGLVALEYRGYGGNTGTPTEAGLVADAEAAYAYAAARYPARQIVLWGESLGSGVAVALAANHPVSKLVLEAPFTSVTDVAAAKLPFIPVGWLLRDQFRSDRRIATVQAPLLIMHGKRDSIIPVTLGERLFALAHEPKQFVRFPEGGHDDLAAQGAIETALNFIAGTNG
jgi:fermentation-respiration switch protein FrsA (DUF1100 family)